MINGTVATQFTLDPRRGIEGAVIVQDWTEAAPASFVNPVKGAEADRVSTPGRPPADQQGDTSTPPAQKYLTADGDIVNLPPGQKSGSEGTSYSLSPNAPGTRPIHEFLNMERAPFRARLELVNQGVSEIHAAPDGVSGYAVIPNEVDRSDGLFDWEGKLIHMLRTATRPELTYATEIGHWIDREIFGKGMVFASDGQRWLDLAEPTPVERLVRAWRQKLENTNAVKILRQAERECVDDPEVARYLKYLLSPPELFARSYAQMIATDGASEASLIIKQQIEELRDREEKNRYWTAEDFAPISEILKNLFK